MLRMPSKKEELERLDVNILAVFCQKVVEAHNDSSLEAHHARELKYEWTSILDPRDPPSRSLEVQEEIDIQVADLKGRMVSFLSAVLPLVDLRESVRLG